MKPIVFLGPSLAVEDARAILDAEYLPPAAAGDVYNAVARGPCAIVIVDGLFDQVPSVWHKEVLYALSEGIPVYGASSLGALRATELYPFGMIGVGTIFEDFRDGTLEDDDEVAVVHGDASVGFRCLSEAMVNLRDGLRRACGAGAISEPTRAWLEGAAKARFYAERSWDAVYADGAALDIAADELANLRAFVRRERPNLKRDDAVRVLEQLAATGVPARHVANFDFHPTCHWIELTLRVERLADQTRDDVVQRLAVESGNASPILRDALFLSLLADEAERLDLVVDAAAIDEAANRLAHVGTDDDREQLANAAAIAGELIARRLEQLGPFVQLALAERGESAASLPVDEVCDSDVDITTLLAWYRASSGIDEATPEAYARRLGLPSARAFVDQLIARYASERT